MSPTVTNSIHRRTIVISLLLTLSCLKGFGQKSSNEWLTSLENAIELSNKYDNEKLRRIDELHQNIHHNIHHNKVGSYNLHLKLFEEYSIFNFDSAHSFANRLQEIAFVLNDPSRIAYSKLKLSFTLLSSGMYKEVFDTLRTINLRFLESNQKAEYYTLMARAHFDLADYNQSEFYSPKNILLANLYLDSALSLYPKNSFEHIYYNGLKFIRARNDLKAAQFLDRLVKNESLTTHERAIATSTYADIFMRREKFDTVISLLCEAAIADIESSTKETSATYYLAILLFQRGDFKRASQIIQKASADAQFYGARQRVIQVNSQVPLIVERLDAVDKDRKNISLYAIIITSLFAILIVLSIIIIKQMGKLRSQQGIINQKNNSLQSLLQEKDTLLEEKEWLRKEIHHRVKNNLQTVVSLLESQSAFLKDGALMAIRDSQHRVYAMSLIHQKLYQSENVSSLHMAVYVPELISYLKESFNAKQGIRFDLQIDSVILNVSQAVPLGIIMTEAISNAVKYAFPHEMLGLIYVEIKKLPTNQVLLMVSDNGIGLPKTFDILNTTSLGIKLMKGLSLDIDAVLKIESAKGTSVSLTFEIESS